ncbi:MAG: DUF1573 domain-containing protein [Bacteroidia bacterium]|nr:DUF1573 domain-containing protein [Bacteroidia bacterium]
MLLIIGSNKLNAQETATPSIDPSAPELTFDNETVDYGTVEYGGNGIREFKFKNTGKTPLIVQNVQGQCGCTTTMIDGKKGWPEEPIAPGKSGVLRVKYDTNRPGPFDKKVTVTTNSKTPSRVITIKGTVKPSPTTPAPTTVPTTTTPQGGK